MIKKVVILFAMVSILLVASVFAQEIAIGEEEAEFVKDVAERKGVSEGDIKGIEKVDFKILPEEINLKNIDETNLAMYEIDVESDRPVYVITASKQMFTQKIKDFSQRMMLSFGISGEVSFSTYLRNAAGVTGDVNQGYVMTRDGAITGLSTNLEITQRDGSLPIEIIIYKAGREVGFRNAFNTDSTGTYSRYDTISTGVLNFKAGETISIKINVPEGTTIKNINTLLEIETE